MTEQTDAAEVEASIRFYVDGECQWTASPHARTLELFGVELAPGPHDITIVLPDAAAREAAAEVRGAQAVLAAVEATANGLDWEYDAQQYVNAARAAAAAAAGGAR